MCFVPGHLVSCLFGWSIIITIEILRSSGKYMKFQASLIINPFSYSVLHQQNMHFLVQLFATFDYLLQLFNGFLELLATFMTLAKGKKRKGKTAFVSYFYLFSYFFEKN